MDHWLYHDVEPQSMELGREELKGVGVSLGRRLLVVLVDKRAVSRLE
jgi:hypothetical protein